MDDLRQGGCPLSMGVPQLQTADQMTRTRHLEADYAEFQVWQGSDAAVAHSVDVQDIQAKSKLVSIPADWVSAKVILQARMVVYMMYLGVDHVKRIQMLKTILFHALNIPIRPCISDRFKLRCFFS